MEAHELLRNVRDELRTRIVGGTEYDALKAGALLRQLLLDEEPLVDAANRQERLKIRYDVVEPRIPLDAGAPVLAFRRMIRTTHSHASRLGRPATLNRNQFLSAKVAVLGGKSIVVADLIRHVSNVLGGVHKGKPTEREKAIHAFTKLVTVEGMPGAVRTIFDIAEIVLAATDELAQ